MKYMNAGYSEKSWKGSASGAMTRIVSAYVSGNALAQNRLPDLINIVHKSLASFARSSNGRPINNEKPTLAQIEYSVQQDKLISFLDGKTYKTLKRHLTAHGLTPESYRCRFGLPDNYPMVAPDYAAKRSKIAKAIQLGFDVQKR